MDDLYRAALIMLGIAAGLVFGAWALLISAFIVSAIVGVFTQ